MNKLPFVSVTSRINNHKDRVFGSWDTGTPSMAPPVSIEIHLTEYCNANCPFCFYGSGSVKEKIRLSDHVLETLVDEIIELKVNSVVLSGGGEPTIHPYFPKVVKKLAENGVEVGLITNGLYHSPFIVEAINLCTWVKYSIHSHVPEIYSKMMGKKKSEFEKVVHNIKTVSHQYDRSVNVSCWVRN